MISIITTIVLLALIEPSLMETCSKDECKDTIVAVIGPTGVGKSSFCNLISGEREKDTQTYPVCEGIDSCTYKTTGKRVSWMGKREKFYLLDTPGLGDSEGRDTQHIDEMTEELRKLKYVNAFLIMFNAANPRLDEFLQAQLNIFVKIFGSGFFENVIMVFNRWEYHAKAEQKRQITGVSKESLTADFNFKFRTIFGVQRFINAYFIDTYPDKNDQKETDAVNNELTSMYDEILQKPAFKCKDIEAVRGYIDNLRNTIDEKEKDLVNTKGRLHEKEEQLDRKEKERAETELKLMVEKIRNEEREASLERERQKEQSRITAELQKTKMEEEETWKWLWGAAKVGAAVVVAVKTVPYLLPIL